MPKASVAEAPRRLANAGRVLSGSPYVGYSYAYPHKTAYRRFEKDVALDALWAGEDRSALFLYLHVPFCRIRCGFCNLLTTHGAKQDAVTAYLGALERQAEAVKLALSPAEFVRVAVGGGTPTFLAPRELERLFEIVARLGARGVPTSVEASPETVDAEKLRVLKALGVTRLSLGVQSFIEQESADMGRPQRTADVFRALELIDAAEIETVNIDLIYGGCGQTVESWLRSVVQAACQRPEEIFLYPLYVRPLTGLDKNGWTWDEQRLALYRAGRDALLSHGYEQCSMRMFRLRRASGGEDAKYCCQQDGMVGLGAGARSYTAGLHYSTEYAVGRGSVLGVIDDYVGQTGDSFAHAHYGIGLDQNERKRRYLIQSLLQVRGLETAAYARWFASEPRGDFVEIEHLVDANLAVVEGGFIRLTPEGLERSDAIGPWLYSEAVGKRMEEFSWR